MKKICILILFTLSFLGLKAQTIVTLGDFLLDQNSLIVSRNYLARNGGYSLISEQELRLFGHDPNKVVIGMKGKGPNAVLLTVTAKSTTDDALAEINFICGQNHIIYVEGDLENKGFEYVSERRYKDEGFNIHEKTYQRNAQGKFLDKAVIKFYTDSNGGGNVIFTSEKITSSTMAQQTIREQLFPGSALISNDKYMKTSKDYYGKEQWELNPSPEIWVVRCPVCKELYNEGGLHSLTDEEEEIARIHWEHEEEAFIRKYFDDTAVRTYLEEGERPWDNDKGFYEFLVNHIEWSYYDYNDEAGKHEQVNVIGGFGESEWLSVSEIEGSWKKYLEWKDKQSQRDNNYNGLFPGRTHAGEGTSSGNGGGFSLAGRTVVGSLTTPTYSVIKQGRVVIEIEVNHAGEVISATYRPAGSTTNDEELISSSIQAAKKSKFNSIGSGEPNQTGTITYNFKLN